MGCEMVAKKLLSILLVLLISFVLVISVLMLSIIFGQSCAPEPFEMEYPEYFTSEYCLNNYIEADPNLISLKSAENIIDEKIYDPPMFFSYYGIKDIPVEKYLRVYEKGAISYGGVYRILKNKDMENEEAIRDYTAHSAFLYWKGKGKIVIMRVITDPEKLRTYIQESLESGNYLEQTCGINEYHMLSKDPNINPNISSDGLYLSLRINFQNYEKLAWQANIFLKDGVYYLGCFAYRSHEYKNSNDETVTYKSYDLVYMPIDSDVLGYDLDSLVTG